MTVLPVPDAETRTCRVLISKLLWPTFEVERRRRGMSRDQLASEAVETWLSERRADLRAGLDEPEKLTTAPK